MTLDEALAEAKRRPGTDVLAVWVRETFGLLPGCGQISPEVYPGEVIITREMVGIYQPDEAIAIAVAVIRGAEQAKERA